MKIQIQKIRPQGIELDETLSPDFIGLTRKDNIHFKVPVELRVKIERAEDEMLAEIHAQSRYESFCDRCLEDVDRDWNAHFTLSFNIAKQTEFIEIDEDIRQELILNLPPRILCKEECKGLCVECGMNLNTQECKHKHAVVSGIDN